MAGAPARFNDVSDGRLDRLNGLDATLEELELRLQKLQLEEERLRGVEQNLLDASTRRIHDFERRLEHEWLALRQLHEEPLKLLNQHAASTVDSCLSVVREALAVARSHTAEPEAVATVAPDFAHERATGKYLVATIILLLLAVATLAVVGYRFRSDLKRMEMRAAAAEESTSQLRRLMDKQIQGSQQTLQRLSAEALSTAARAERLANILAAPDVRAYPLRGQRTAAAAEGQVSFSASRGLALTASRLPPAPADRVYQVWVTTPRGPVSLGFVSPDAMGRVSAAHDVPSEISESIIGFMLSAEPTGGSVKPTGPIVLTS